ncbi:MAG: metallophosphatase family protein [Actinobacteria bacterium]|nr:metallophosphatase family protein [Actinomycetota bacterium]
MSSSPKWHEREFTRKGFIAGVFTLLVSISPFAKTLAASKVLSAKLKSSPTSSAATLSVTASQDLKFLVEYGFVSGKYDQKTPTFSVKKNSTTEVSIKGLTSNTKVFYRFRYLLASSKNYVVQTGGSFVTAKDSASSLFAVQADPHMDENSDENVYRKTLEQVAAASPAFLMDLGDIFMVDKLKDKTEANIRARFELMKGFYKTLGNIPLKITLGNHDGELGYSKFNTKSYRKEYFPEQTGELAYYSFSGPDQLQGHDHLYVKQELDGVIYQTVPQPSHPGEKLDVKQYGYLSGKAVGGSGFLKVQTSGKVATVDFIKFDGSVGDSYTRTAL